MKFYAPPQGHAHSSWPSPLQGEGRTKAEHCSPAKFVPNTIGKRGGRGDLLIHDSSRKTIADRMLSTSSLDERALRGVRLSLLYWLEG